jgi:hypothetical protein
MTGASACAAVPRLSHQARIAGMRIRDAWRISLIDGSSMKQRPF